MQCSLRPRASHFGLALKRLARARVGRGLFLREQIAVPRERLGSEYGGWWIHPGGLDSESVAYSFGVGDDVTFDVSLIEKYGMRVLAFDPTPRSVACVNARPLPKRFEFHALVVADFEGEAEFEPPAP